MRLTKLIAPAVAGAALAMAAPYAASAQNFDDPKEFQAAQDLLKMTPSGPEGKPWEQNLGGKEVDTSKYKKPGPYRICFSNAGVDNPWRVVGWINMQAQVDVLEGRHQVLQGGRRAGQGRQADLRHQRLRAERRLRRADRLAEHDGGA